MMTTPAAGPVALMTASSTTALPPRDGPAHRGRNFAWLTAHPRAIVPPRYATPRIPLTAPMPPASSSCIAWSPIIGATNVSMMVPGAMPIRPTTEAATATVASLEGTAS